MGVVVPFEDTSAGPGIDRLSGLVASDLQRVNKTIHIGRLFDLCVEKQNELVAHLLIYGNQFVV